MRTFRYNQQLEIPRNGVHSVTIERTEAEILEDYFCDWAQRMINTGNQDLITEKACIDDWIGNNEAWEVPTEVNNKPRPMTQIELERTGQDLRD